MGTSGVFMVVFIFWSSYLVHPAEPYSTYRSQITMCSKPQHVSYGVGDHGTIVSSEYPNPGCTLTLTACQRCRISLNFTELAYDPDDGHPNLTAGCNYLMLSEPGYPDLYRHISPFNTNVGSYYISQTRVINIRYCSADTVVRPKFTLTFETLEKNFTVLGQSPDFGFLESLGFPNGYGPNGDTFIYHLRNKDHTGFVKLSFDDWHLSSQCFVHIKMVNSTVSVSGAHSRPFVMSDGPNITLEVVFATNIQTFGGFKARYEFVRSRFWSDKPKFADEFYLVSNFGEKLELDCRKYPEIGWADFLWVISRSSINGNSSLVMLRLLQPTLLAGDTLEIRRANNSNGELMDLNQPADYFSSDGFHIRLRMKCSISRSFRAVFAWIKQTHGFLNCDAPYGYRCAVKHYCISDSLVCDGVDHCGDYSDESNCRRTPVPTERLPADCHAFYACDDGQRVICDTKRCDRKYDCQDHSDEFMCDYLSKPSDRPDPFRSYPLLATVVPLVVVTVITFIIVLAVITFIAQRRRHLAAVRRMHQMVREGLTVNEDNFGSGFSDGDIDLAASEQRLIAGGHVAGPPSYEDVVTCSHGTDASGNSSLSPPPYSVAASDADKDSSTTTDGLPSQPPTYTATLREVDNVSDLHPLIHYGASDGTQVSSDCEVLSPCCPTPSVRNS